MAFRCFACDVTTEYVFGFTFGSLESPRFQCPTLKGLDNILAGFWMQKHLTWLRFLTNLLSPWSLRILYPQSQVLFDKVFVREMSYPGCGEGVDLCPLFSIYKLCSMNFYTGPKIASPKKNFMSRYSRL
jgi:hypothetical protein